MVSGGTHPPDAAFLRLLDPDPAKAEQKYGDLVRRLTKFFQFRHCESPEDLAQETVLRVLQKVGRATISVEPAAFFQGFAKNLVHEARRAAARDARRLVPLNEDLAADGNDHDPSHDRTDEPSTAFERPAGGGFSESQQIDRYEQWRLRLKEMPPDERELVVAYYSRDKLGRRQLAAEKGLTEGAMRTKVCRIKAGRVRRS
jgi:RNA polymerase sigma factor (sigma-70 family)